MDLNFHHLALFLFSKFLFLGFDPHRVMEIAYLGHKSTLLHSQVERITNVCKMSKLALNSDNKAVCDRFYPLHGKNWSFFSLTKGEQFFNY